MNYPFDTAAVPEFIKPVVDSMIAATALVHDLIIITRNETDLVRSGPKFSTPGKQASKGDA